MVEGAKKDKQRAEFYDALGHPMRLAILKALSEAPMGFAELKRRLTIDSSGHLKHHLNKLNSLIKTDEYGKYCLSDNGKDALLTMHPIEKYNEDARFREQVGLLIRALRSDITSVQEIAVVQLSLFGPRAIPYLRSALSEAFSEPSNPELNNMIDYTEDAISGLINILGIISVPATVPDIVKALPRPEAFEALAKIGNKQALDAVISSMPKWYSKYVDLYYSSERKPEDVDDFLRKIFGHFDQEDVKTALENALNAGEETAKSIAARILAVVGDSHSFPALIDALENGNCSTKTEVARALIRLRASEAVPNIIAELVKIQGYSPSSKRDNTSADHDAETIRTAKDALSDAVLKLGSVDNWLQISFHRPKLDLRKSSHFDGAIINSGEKAIPELTKLLQAPDSDVQQKAAEMIARIKRGDKVDKRSYFY